MTTVPPYRPLGGVFLFGMLTIPALCCWFSLRRGYAPSFRRTVFTYTAVVTFLPIIGRLAA